MIKTITIDTDSGNVRQLQLLAELLVLCSGKAIMVERGTHEVMPLEALGAAVLTLTEAWNSINASMEKKHRAEAGQ